MNKINGLCCLLLLLTACDDGNQTGAVADASVQDGATLPDMRPPIDFTVAVDRALPPDRGAVDATPPDRGGAPDAAAPDAATPDAAPPPCAGDVECGAGRWCTAAGACEDGCHLAPDDCGANRRCDADTRECVACLATDTCGNGIDDNCDGVVDDGCACTPDAACETGLAGPCGIGRVVCTGDTGQCVPARVGAETCNGTDDDCDGTTDEGFAGLGDACAVGEGACLRRGVLACAGEGVACNVAPGAPGGELCNDLDDDCDGQVDENWADLGDACVVGLGACERAGARVCDGANATRCGAAAGAPGGEQCNAIDDDCDGRTDEGAAGGALTRACYEGPPGTENVGFCHGGRTTCENGQFAVCAGQVLPVPEICNGEDDNCDGRVDRDANNQRIRQACYSGPAGTAGEGACVAGIAECQFGQLGACVGEVVPSPEQCDAADDDCNGQVDDVAGGCACAPGEVRDCYPGPAGTAGVGACVRGRQTCQADGSGFGACVGAVVPAAEVCDGRDNNCNGQIDDAVAGVGAACTEGQGVCAARGVARCDGQAIVCDAVPGAPRPEQCNGLDDNCDGRIDEGFLLGRPCEGGIGACVAQGDTICGAAGEVVCGAVPGAPGVEACNNSDDDCDGTIDEGLLDLGACNSGRPGVCADGHRACRAGAERCEPGLPGEEVCNGIDDDCDLLTDEGQGNQPCGVGICARVLPTCRDGAPVQCNPLQGAGEERCNGLDDDCDGGVDEGLGLGQACNGGVGVCSSPGRIICDVNGLAVCSGVPGQPRLEVCNALDDDCDGRTDEQIQGLGAACSAGRGGCLRNGVTQCVAGAVGCSVVAGDPGAEVCNATDDDCDGLTDERLGVGNGCAAGEGECRRPGLQVCGPNGSVVCNAVPAQPAAETCNGFDDDCDTRTDEQAQGANVACSAGVGGCRRQGITQCAQARLSCNAVPGQPDAERCDAIDNDCDQITDETPLDAGGNCSEGVGQCAAQGRFVCVAGALDCNANPRQPVAEVCDTLDQDCDGRSDEGQPDCDANGFMDACDIQARRQADCNLNGIPDRCDVAAGMPDCDHDGTPDVCNDACVVDQIAPVVDLFVGGNPINRGTQIQIVVIAQDNVGVTECRLFVGLQEIPLDGNCQAFVTFNQPGFFDVIGIARDAAGNEGRDEVRMRVLDPNDVDFPVLVLHAPANNTVVRQATPVVATITDANLVGWVLSYGPVANPAANVISQGNVNVNNQVIGTLDPAIIPVGQYGFQLTAEDINGRTRTLTGGFTVGACEPAAEQCNGRDDDCDGRTDETFAGLGGACQAGVGACSAVGTVVCSANGVATTCNAPVGAPQAERCDAIDWDCNGNPLNGFAVGQACSAGRGACLRNGQTRCNAAANGVECNVQAGQPAAEACNATDDDCDGRIDEGICPDLNPPVIVLVVQPQTVAVGEPVVIRATASDDRGPVSLEVTVNGVVLVLEGAGEARFAAPNEGDFAVVAVAEDEAGNITRAEELITAVQARPTAVVDVRPPRLARGDGRRTVVTLDGSGSFGGGNLTWQWSIPEGVVVGGGLNQPIVRVTLPGDHDHGWTLRVANALGTDLAQGSVRINGRPLADIDAPVSLPVGSELTLDAGQSSDPEGDVLQFAWRLVEAPVGSVRALQGPAAEVATFVPDVGGLYRFELIVGDGLEDSEPATRAVVATSPDRTPPAVAVQFSSNPASPGVPVTITVQANDASGIAVRRLLVEGVEVALDGAGRASFNPPVEGRYAVRALATDNAGNLGGVDSALFVASLPNNGAPTVAITAPADGYLANGAFDLRGTATDADLASYLVQLSPRGRGVWTTVFEGTDPVDNGLLARVEPSGLAGGQYDLRLVAFDARGNSRETSIFVEVSPKAAFARMRREFLDAQVALSGIPIEIRRIYDSGNKVRGDFGVGWTLDIGAGHYEESNPVAEFWDWNGRCVPVFGPPGAVNETDSHIFTIFLGDEAYRFYAAMVFRACGGGFQEVRVEYRALPGTHATLVPTGDDLAWHIDGTLFTRDDLEIWTPGLLRMTLSDGRVIFYDPVRGVQRVEDAGSVLTIDAQGVHHSNGTSINMTRDALGRVTSVVLPDNNVRTYQFDGRDDLVQTVDFRGGETFYQYDFDHNLVRLIDPRGNVPLSMEYDAFGRLVAYVDAEGNRIEVGHEGADRQEIITNRRGHRTIFSYDANGNVLEIIDALGGRRAFTYDAEGHILTETDQLGHVSTNTYDANGNRTARVDGNGERWAWTYDADGNVLTETNPEGNSVLNGYDAAGRLTRKETATGAVTAWTFDASGHNTQVVDPEGNTSVLAYAADGALARITDPQGTEYVLSSDRAGNLARSVHMRETIDGPVQEEWRYAYDSDGELDGFTGPEGTQAAFMRDEAGQVIGASDSKGDSTLTLDALGRIRERRLAGGNSVRVDYDAEGNDTVAVLPGGARLERSFDALNRLTSVRTPEGGVVSQVYDAAGRVIRRTTALGSVMTFDYDAVGNLSRTEAPGGAATLFERDGAGRLTAITDAVGGRWAFELDAGGRTTRKTMPDGSQEAWTYNGNDKPTTWQQAGGALWRYGWSALGELAEVTDPLGEITHYEYDGGGRLQRMTDAEGRVTAWLFDALGRLTERRMPAGEVERMAYDARGLMTSRTDFNGDVTRYTYDEDGRQTRVELPEGTDIRTAYDSGGRATQVEDSRGITHLERDVRGRVLRWQGPTGDVLTRMYDLDGQVTESTTAAGTSHYGYNGRSELTGIVDPDGWAFAVDRDLLGRPTVVHLPDGSTRTRTYDAVGHVTRITQRAVGGALRQELVYTYDASGRVARLQEDDGRTVDYQYDLAGRVTQERITTPGQGVETIDLVYDATGNVVRRSDAGGVRDFQYDANDRLLDDDRYTYTWDAEGRLIGRQGAGVNETWRYDGLGRLSVVERDGLPDIQYRYDHDGPLAERQVGADIQRFIWDRVAGVPTLAEIRDGDGELVVRYVHGADGVLAQIQGDGTLEIPTVDHLGTVRGVDRGGVLTRLRYDAYGATRGAVASGLGYIGAWTDPDTDLVFLQARWYSPEATRFITPDSDSGDPSDPRTINRYVYGLGDPINRSDPDGRFSLVSVSISLTIVGILAGMALAVFPSALEFIFTGLGAFRALRFQNNTAVMFPFFSATVNRGFAGIGVGLELLKFNSGVWALYVYIGAVFATGQPAKGFSASLNAAFGLVYDTRTPDEYLPWSIGITASGSALLHALSRRITGLPAGISYGKTFTIFWSPTETYKDGDGKSRYGHGWNSAAQSWTFGGGVDAGGVGKLSGSISITFAYYIKILETGQAPTEDQAAGAGF